MLNVFLFNRKSRILRVGKKAEATTSTRRVSFLAELLKEETPLFALDSARSAVRAVTATVVHAVQQFMTLTAFQQQSVMRTELNFPGARDVNGLLIWRINAARYGQDWERTKPVRR